MSSKSIRAIENIRKIADEHMLDKYELDIIDVSKEKKLASEYQLIGLPTLIKEGPKPVRTILGDLSDTEKVLRILDLKRR